ncbi:TauD/TfdA family dioxygenase, partial [Streptomyces clavuligerus]
VMLCAAAAAEGGHSFLVDLPAAFAVLRERDPEAAAQLVHPGALVRTSTLVQGRSRSGPAFAPDGDGGWVTRFSRTATDTYHPLSGGGAALGRALEFLDEAAAEGSRFRAGFTLAAGQALVLANDRLGHGRTAYRDDPDVPRLLLRGLFTRRPAPVAVGGRTS